MPTAKNNLSSSDVCVIIEACSKHGVLELKFQDLHITLGKSAIKEDSEPITNQPVTEISGDQHDKQTAIAIENDEVSLREQQIEELLITNPLAAEEMLENGEFDDADEFGDE